MERIRSCKCGGGRRGRGDGVGLNNTSSGRSRRFRRWGSRRDMGGAFQRVLGVEDVRGIGGWTSGTVSKVELKGDFEMMSNEGVSIEAGEAIDIFHHARWAVEDLKEVAKELLGPATDLVDGADIFKNLLDGAAIAEPEEF
jgi:hypothetical protein